MSNLLTDCRQKLFDTVPNGGTISWADALTSAGDRRPLINALAFGKPGTISRRGNSFTCTGATSASKQLNNFRLYSEKVVRFTMAPSGHEIVVTNISGISVEPPTGLGRFALQNASISISANGSDVYLRTTKFFVSVTMVVEVATGKLKSWYVG